MTREERLKEVILKVLNNNEFGELARDNTYITGVLTEHFPRVADDISKGFADVVSSFEPTDDEIWEKADEYLLSTNLNKDTLPERMKYHIRKAFDAGILWYKAKH